MCGANLRQKKGVRKLKKTSQQVWIDLLYSVIAAVILGAIILVSGSTTYGRPPDWGRVVLTVVEITLVLWGWEWLNRKVAIALQGLAFTNTAFKVYLVRLVLVLLVYLGLVTADQMVKAGGLALAGMVILIAGIILCSQDFVIQYKSERQK
jgi:hypothetical protein